MADPELRAVESALNALALAESETALQKVVTRLLPAVLSALSTKSSAARAKCIETLQHINVRVRANTNIKLPFHEVLQVAIKPDAAILTVNVAIQGGYLTRCFERLTAAEKADALPVLLKAAVAVVSPVNSEALHLLAIHALVALDVQTSKNQSVDRLWSALADCPEHAVFSFFDFSLRALRIKLKVPVSEQALIAVIRLASEYSGNNQPERAARVFLHFLVAAGTASRSALMAVGEDAMKKVDTCDVLAAADPTIAGRLFDLFNDTLAEIPLRIVVLSKGLLNVTLCASYFPEVLSVIKLSLHTPGIPPRFQALGMQFVSFVFGHADQDVLTENAAPLTALLIQLATNETHGSPSFADAVRAFGVTGLGELILRVPSLFGKTPLTPQFFFGVAQSREQPAAVRTAASQMLIAVTRVLAFDRVQSPDFHASVIGALRNTLRNTDDAVASARSAAVQWANDCFQFVDCDARLLNIIAAADSKQDVRQYAIAGLTPKRWRLKDGTKRKDADNSATNMPKLKDVVQAYGAYVSEHDVDHPLMIEAYLKFSFYIVREAVVSGGKLELAHIDDVDKFFADNDGERDALVKLVKAADDVLLERRDAKASNLERSALSVVIFASKVKALRKDISERYASRIDDLVRLAVRKSATGDSGVARAIAMVIGVASETLSECDLKALVEKLGLGLEPDSSGVASGRTGEDERVASILCIGQIIVRCRRRTDVEVDGNETNPLSKACLDISRRIMLPVESTDVVRIAACVSLSDIGATAPLPILSTARTKFMATLSGILKVHSTSSKLVQAAADTIGKVCIGEPRSSFKRTAGESLLQLCKERKEEDLQFVIAESLTRSSSGFDAPPPASLEETDGKANESLDTSAAEVLQSVMDMRTEPFEVKEPIDDDGDNPSMRYGVLSAIRGAIQLAFDERPAARAGGCVCLFTLLSLLGRKSDGSSLDMKISFRSPDDADRFKSQQGVALEQLGNIQGAFTILLGDRSEFVQQLASCGVALAYEMCPREGQHDLVTTLVRSLTSGKSKSAAIVPGDQGTILQFEGTDVQENSGGAPKSATYKELCSLAQDMGQPDMVYKFMDLAGHAALWNSRKGAALAGSALLGNDLAAEQLRPHLKTLLPRLYVYCYDPTESVRIAMGSVLSAVIKASGLGSVFEAVTEHFDVVTRYCLKSMTSRQWRSREAACGALRDALSSRTWEQVKHSLSEFWYYTMRALDDIKETVRKAAGGTGRALSELSTHLCDPAQVGVDIAREASAVVIPVVMPGIMHKEESVRAFAGTTMTKLIRYGGEALRGSVADLMSMLLEAASELEPQMLNYAQFHVDNPSNLEDMRVSSASTSASPLVESLERLAALVDESNVEETVRAMVRLAKVGVGIPTRAATARLFQTLLRTRAVVVGTHAPKLMWSALNGAAMERNGVLKMSWCLAAGTAVKLCGVSSVTKFVDRVVELGRSEEERERELASCLAVALWRKSPDTGRQHASAMLPMAYLGAHEIVDGEESTANSDRTVSGGKGTAAENWTEVWDEGAPSTEAGLRHYAKEITEISVARLKDSAKYRVKRSAAATLGAMAEASNESANIECFGTAARALLVAVDGHLWEGKVAVIEAIGAIGGVHSSENIWKSVEGSSVGVVGVLLGETGRGKMEYKIAAMNAAASVLRGAGSEVRMFGKVVKRLEEFWGELARLGAGDLDGKQVVQTVWETGSDASAVEAKMRKRKARKGLCVAAVGCIVAAVRAGKDGDMVAFVNVVDGVVRWPEWEVRVAGLDGLKKIFERCGLGDGNAMESEGVMEKVMGIVAVGMRDGKYAAVRKKALECLMTIGEKAGHAVLNGRLKEEAKFCEDIVKMAHEDGDIGVQAVAKKLCVTFEVGAS